MNVEVAAGVLLIVAPVWFNADVRAAWKAVRIPGHP